MSRVRESYRRVFDRGAGELSNEELLELVLVEREDAEEGLLDLAQRLLEECGSLSGLSRTTASGIYWLDGVRVTQAARVVAAFELGWRARKQSDRP